jgi:hypothetical protein
MSLPPFVTIGSEVQVFAHPEGGTDLASTVFTADPKNEVVIEVPTSNTGYVAPPAPETIPDQGVGSTTVTVVNPRNVPVTLLMEHGRFDTRIGTVPAASEKTLSLPGWIANEEDAVELFIHPEGGVDLTSQTFQLTPGAHFLLKVPAN